MRKQSVLAVGLGLAFTGCLGSEPNSALNTEGPPRVITATVVSETRTNTGLYGAGSGFGQFGAYNMAATFCSSDAGEKLNGYYCPTDGAVTDASPVSWEAWLVFNELLDPDKVEELCSEFTGASPCVDGQAATLANTQPVTVTCNGQEIPYDGYWDPTGSHLTDPAGPALVIQPIFPDAFVATGSSCEITVKQDANIVADKDGNAVASTGPFTFQIAPMRLIDPEIEGVEPTDPATASEGVDIAVTPIIQFNAYVDQASLDGKIELLDTSVDPAVPVDVALEAGLDIVLVTPAAPLNPETPYLLRVNRGVTDTKGGTLQLPGDVAYEATFTTGAAP